MEINGNTQELLESAIKYLNGDGVKKDPKKAVEMFKQAAAMEDLQGMVFLSLCYEYGIGVQKNLTVADNIREKAMDLYGF